MHILDTDTFTFLFERHPRVQRALQEVDDPNVCTTVITRIEVLRGRFDFLFKAADASQFERAQGLLEQTDTFLMEIPILGMDDAASLQFKHLQTTKGLKKIGRGDLLIASIALAHDAVLVTRNLKHFRQVPRLRLANWVD